MNELQVIKPGAGVESPARCEGVPDYDKTTLQCAAPTPITTGTVFLFPSLLLVPSCDPQDAVLLHTVRVLLNGRHVTHGLHSARHGCRETLVH